MRTCIMLCYYYVVCRVCVSHHHTPMGDGQNSMKRLRERRRKLNKIHVYTSHIYVWTNERTYVERDTYYKYMERSSLGSFSFVHGSNMFIRIMLDLCADCVFGGSDAHVRAAIKWRMMRHNAEASVLASFFGRLLSWPRRLGIQIAIEIAIGSTRHTQFVHINVKESIFDWNFGMSYENCRLFVGFVVMPRKQCALGVWNEMPWRRTAAT